MFAVAPKAEPISFSDDPSKRTTDPIVTGGSVLAVKYKDGILIAADTLAAYGSLLRFKDMERIRKVGDYTIIGAGGEMSDFDYIMNTLREEETNDWACDDGSRQSPKDICNLLARIMYNKRSRVNPLWNSLVVGGFKDGQSYLGLVDMYGTHYEDDHLATGFGAYLARPIMRSRHRNDMTEQEARELLNDCLRVLFYRDCRTINKFQISRASADGLFISEPYSLDTMWEYSRFVNPGTADSGSW